jgi:hypothetical protein
MNKISNLSFMPLTLLMGCYAMNAKFPFEFGYKFRDSNPDIIGIVSKNPKDDLIYIYFNINSEMKQDDIVVSEKQKGINYDMFVSGIGGIRDGEIKKIPKFDGWCTLSTDTKIYCSEVGLGSGMPEFYVLTQGLPDYEIKKNLFNLRNPGDTTLFREKIPLPRQGA